MQYQNQSLYNVDIVFCIDATGSMKPHIERVKEHALKFYSDVDTKCKAVGKIINTFRIRVIAFRDFYEDENPLVSSPFFELPGKSSEFRKFVTEIQATGGGDAPETGLEALATAMQSTWQSAGSKRRQIIVVFTDAPAHPLEKSGKKSNYPKNMPKNLDVLTDMWEGQTALMHSTYKRLILFAPDAYPWSQIGESWELTIHHTAQAGSGLSESDYNTILAAIANSI